MKNAAKALLWIVIILEVCIFILNLKESLDGSFKYKRSNLIYKPFTGIK